MSVIEDWLAKINSWVWGWTLIGLLMAVGLFLCVRTRFMPHRQLKLAFRCLLDDRGEGEVSAFSSLCTALAATIGTGNIVGVATAVCVGGPGAVFWMVVAALLGMGTIYAEGLLAVKYRRRQPDGSWLGGPFCYIEQGLGPAFRPLARIFAWLGLLAGTLGIGTAVQSNSITAALAHLVGDTPEVSLWGHSYPLSVVVGGVLTAILAGMVLLGGVQRITAVAGVAVPVAAGIFILLQLLILFGNISRLPSACSLIIRSAFTPRAALGAGSGVTLKLAVRLGVGRGVFSNEAGLGSAPIAAACARCDSPVRQGLVSMLGTFIDTVVMCTLTGIVLVVTGAWSRPGQEGVAVTADAFSRGLPYLPPWLPSALLYICLTTFTFTTVIGWNVYGERCLYYLTNGYEKIRRLWQLFYIGAVLIGPFMSLTAVWDMANVFNGLMAFPNLLALLLLSTTVAKETRDYFKK